MSKGKGRGRGKGPLTWNELAALYDAEHSGRKARTLPMEYVADWAERKTEMFHVSEDGSFYLKDGA